jgi:hypothetical protein
MIHEGVDDLTTYVLQPAPEARGWRGTAVIPVVLAMGLTFLPVGTTAALAATARGGVVTAGVVTTFGGFPGRADLSSWPSPATATADSVRDLREFSGLNWDELARLFNVSRRTVHYWATGGRMNQFHAQRLNTISQTLRPLAQGTREATRAALLAPDASGSSEYQRLLMASADTDPHREGLVLEQLLS